MSSAINPINRDYQTNLSPSLAPLGSNLVLGFLGLANPGPIFSAISSDGISWTVEPNSITGTNDCVSAPALVTFKGSVYAFYLVNDPQPGQSNISYMSTSDGKSWENFNSLPGACFSTESPSAVVYANKLYIFYKGYGNDDPHIYGVYSTDGVSWNLINAN